MVRIGKFLVYAGVFLLLGLGGCFMDDYPSAVELDLETIPEPPKPIVPPCSYDKIAEVENEYKMSGKISVSTRDYSTRMDINLAFYGSLNQIRISLFGGWKLSDLQSQIVDFANPSKPDIKMEVNGLLAKYPAISGKLYIIKNDDGSYKYDWCDVVFEDPQDNSIRHSHGGFTLIP